MFRYAALVNFAFLAVASAQQVGTVTAETHPSLTVQQCAAGGTCTTLQRSVVLDSNWRWVHDTAGYTNCYTGNTWDATLCPDATTCAEVSVDTLFSIQVTDRATSPTELCFGWCGLRWNIRYHHLW